MREFHGERIELAAADPEPPLACDITVANNAAREGLPQALRLHMQHPIRGLADGVEVRFALEGWEDVQRYVALEAQCCSFLTLRAEQTSDAVVLRVTGRPAAKAWIDQIFS